ncbi:MAG: bacterioferritin-associated ferredoxin [Glaciecola sp.]|jgi:bacterioferritin-associated ferredoxin
MFVCMCYGITDKQIKSAVETHGVGNMRELKQIMELGSQCGKCIELAQEIIDNTIVDETLFMDVG